MASSVGQHTPPESPTGSAYDLSDDEDAEYTKIMTSSSGRGVKLLFSKSKVRRHKFANLRNCNRLHWS